MAVPRGHHGRCHPDRFTWAHVDVSGGRLRLRRRVLDSRAALVAVAARLGLR